MADKEESKTDNAMFQTRLSQDLLGKSKALAKKRGMSLAAMVRGLLIRETDAEGRETEKETHV